MTQPSAGPFDRRTRPAVRLFPRATRPDAGEKRRANRSVRPAVTALRVSGGESVIAVVDVADVFDLVALRWAEAGVGEAVDRVFADRLDPLELRAQLVVRKPAEHDGFDRAVEVSSLIGGDVREVAGRIVAGRRAGAGAHRLDQLVRVQVGL